jgi:hypothetical protein
VSPKTKKVDFVLTVEQIQCQLCIVKPNPTSEILGCVTALCLLALALFLSAFV